MGMAELEEGLSLVAEHPDASFFAGPRDEDLVKAAEMALGVTFPPTYRPFRVRAGGGRRKRSGVLWRHDGQLHEGQRSERCVVDAR